MFRSNKSQRNATSPQQYMDWRSAGALTAATSLLVLSLPGVSIVRASDDIAASGGQTCEAPTSVDQTMEAVVEELRRVQAAQAAQAVRFDSAGEPIYALNNSGFNYRPVPAPVETPPGPSEP